MVTLVTIHSLDERRTHFDQAGIYAALSELSRELRLTDHWERRRGGYAPRWFEESEHRDTRSTQTTVAREDTLPLPLFERRPSAPPTVLPGYANGHLFSREIDPDCTAQFESVIPGIPGLTLSVTSRPFDR